MGKLFDNRMVEKAYLSNLSISFEPIGSGNPTKWKVLATATFMCLDKEGNFIGSVMSGGDKVPYFVIIENLDKRPTMQEILDYLFDAEERLNEFVREQLFNLSGERL